MPMRAVAAANPTYARSGSKPFAFELSPARHWAVEPHDKLGEHDADQRDHDNRNEKLRRCKHVGIFDNHAAEPADRGEELGDDDSDDGQADREPDAGHDEWNRRRQDDLPENL